MVTKSMNDRSSTMCAERVRRSSGRGDARCVPGAEFYAEKRGGTRRLPAGLPRSAAPVAVNVVKIIIVPASFQFIQAMS